MSSKGFVYIIKSKKNGQIYTGFTADLENRLKQHNEGESGFTKGKGPWELIWYSRFKDRNKAKAFEEYLKTGSGIAFMRKRFL